MILGKTFQRNLWIFVGVTFALHLLYLKLYMKPWLNCIFEIISVLLQHAPSKSIGNPLLFSTFIVLSAFLAFHYTWEMAAGMISPPVPFSHSTLTELLQNGFKLLPFRIRARTNEIPAYQKMSREYADRQWGKILVHE